MKAILEFTLPEENEEFYLATHAPDMHSALFEIMYNLRKKVTHKIEAAEENGMIYNAHDTIELIYEHIHEITSGIKVQ